MNSLPAQFYGHSKVQQLVVRQLNNDNLPHALLFSGPGGVGKAAFATFLARALMCLSPTEDNNLAYRQCGACESCRMFRSGNHPDFLRIDCAERASNTELIRELMHVLHLKPYAGNRRVVVLEQSDFLPIQALNILLKAIEEPHSGTFFVLTSSNRSRLLPTIVSRCQLYSFGRLTDLELSNIIEDQFPDLVSDLSLEERRALAELSDGSLDRFRHLQDKLALWKKIRTFVSACCSGAAGVDVDAITTARQLCDSEKQAPTIIFELIVLACRRALNEQSDPEVGAVLSVAILNTLEAERLVRERNLNAVYTLQLVLSELATGSREPIWEGSAGLSQYTS